jgi:hypothetical protein
MKGLENNSYVTLLLISNFIAIVLLYTAWKYPRFSRFLFVLLFTWAGWMNWRTLLNNPESYLEYGRLTFLPFYERFINGWFSKHIVVIVGIIATSQLLIAIGLQSKGKLFKVAAVGAILFFISIVPLGVGSGFPCSLIMAIAMYQLLKRPPANYLWVSEQKRLVH